MIKTIVILLASLCVGIVTFTGLALYFYANQTHQLIQIVSGGMPVLTTYIAYKALTSEKAPNDNKLIKY